MKILIAGDWRSELHEQPVFQALLNLGHDVHRFAWHTYFDASGRAGRLRPLFARLQNKYLFGPLVRRLNVELLQQSAFIAPELLFIYRGTHICAATIRAIRSRLPGVIIVGYNNDDPFAPDQPRWLWRHFFACLKEYDVALAYRQHNLEDFRRHGARRTYLLRSWFVPQRNHPVVTPEREKEAFNSEVVFVGHYENDGRLELLEAVVGAGHRLRLFGPGYDWDPVLAGSKALRDLRPVKLVWGEDYNKALCGSKVALCFFSRLNRDTYTRRCFEIPATGTMMLSEYSSDLASMFAEGREAEFFRSKEEMLSKLHLYLEDDSLRRSVAEGGMARVHADGHDVQSRMSNFLNWLHASSTEKSGRHAG